MSLNAAGEEGDDGRESDCEDVFDLDMDWEIEEYLDLGPPELGR